MSAMRSGMGLAFDLAGAAMWALAAFFIGARLLTPAAGGVLALAVFLSALSFMLSTRLQESRARALLAGDCPRCEANLSLTHEHRRWDTSRLAWLPPLTAWECAACGYGHEEPAPCERCPEAI